MALGEVAHREPWQAKIGLWEKAQVDGVPVQADVFQLPALMSVFPGVTEGVAFHGLDHVILQVQRAQAEGQRPRDGIQHVVGQVEKLQLLQRLHLAIL